MIEPRRHPKFGSEALHGVEAPSKLREPASPSHPLRAGFTLIELILVMTILLIVLSLIGPSLSGFFRGRTLDSEARRFLALTRYAQSRAVSEGVPMLIWIDAQRREFGVQSEFSYTGVDEQSKEFELSPTLEIEVSRTVAAPLSSATGSSGLGRSGSMTGMNLGAGRNGLQIRFLPDGSIAETSPDLILLRESPRNGALRDSQASTTYIGQSLNRLYYEIRTNQFASYRR